MVSTSFFLDSIFFFRTGYRYDYLIYSQHVDTFINGVLILLFYTLRSSPVDECFGCKVLIRLTIYGDYSGKGDRGERNYYFFTYYRYLRGD